jgi:hypothetical protein
MNLSWLQDVVPEHWLIMRNAAIARHAALVFPFLGFTPLANEVMELHMLIVRAVYDKRT